MLEQKLQFHEISLADQKWMKEKLAEDDLGACEYTFANNFIWRNVYQAMVTQLYGCGVIRFREDAHSVSYSFPFGNGDKKAAISKLLEECHALGQKCSMYPIVEEDRLELLEWFPGQFEIDIDRDDFDYVYSVEKLSTLKGKKLHGKRNHIARFKDAQDWSYESMSDANIEECRRMAKNWISLREEKWNEEMEQEMQVLEEAFSNFKELSLVGGVLRKQDEIVAFTIGEPLNSDTFVVHFEKAFPDLQGAYPMINQQFVLNECQEYNYVNREEDTGDLGLRKAKLSYYPDLLLKKYRAVESRVVFANEKDTQAISEIWQTCFGDEEEYIQFYMENRFQTENMLVIHEDGRPVSMASFLPVHLVVQGEFVEAKYVYAVATLPQYRKKGYAAEILSYAAKKYQVPLILQPADAMLEDYYGKMGFVSLFRKEKMEVEVQVKEEMQFNGETQPDFAEKKHPDLIAGWEFQSVTPKDYKRIRDAHFMGDGYVCWEEEAIDYALYENNYCGGCAVRLVPVENAEDWVAENAEEKETVREEVILYRRRKHHGLTILETTLELEELRKLAPALLQELGEKKMTYQLEGGMVLFPTETMKAHFMEGQESNQYLQKAYLNLTLS